MELHIAGKKKKFDVADAVFGCDYNGPLIHQIVTAYLAGGRAGTKAQKTRSQVSGGGAKPFNQKGSGRARAGTIRSPLWRKGGKIFAAVPRSYAQKVNKKMYRSAIRSILSELLRLERLIVLEDFAIDAPKTKNFLKKLSELKLDQNERILVVTEAIDENLYLSSRNLPTIDVRDVLALDPVALVGADKMIITVAAIKQLEESLK